MFQKIFRLSTFWTPQNDKNARLDVTDFQIFNIWTPPHKMRKMQIWMFQKILRF